jgi:hypothetical protein
MRYRYLRFPGSPLSRTQIQDSGPRTQEPGRQESGDAKKAGSPPPLPPPPPPLLLLLLLLIC